jgi:hypothetical protein
MRSTLTWIDHDPAARERSQRILALFKEKESRDELGLGAIRDAFADSMFPGTSTIQTRLRYMFFVPWVYQTLERQRVPVSDFAMRARNLELGLVQPLLDGSEWGIFGVQAGKKLKRLPSSVYWAGLGSWGIRRFQGSQDEYHRAVGELYIRRDRHRERDDFDGNAETHALTWHPRLPSPPSGFPKELSFSLTEEEAGFLRDRIVTSHPTSLLAWLVQNSVAFDSTPPYPWAHPEYGRFTAAHRELLEHARRFSEVMNGAAVLYNLQLAELAGAEPLREVHSQTLSKWAAELNMADINSWSLPRLWALTFNQGHTITGRAQMFVESWVDLVRNGAKGLARNAEARALVRNREMQLKGARSRFRNKMALEQWGGYAGTGRMNYRWPTVVNFLSDLNGVQQEG